MMVRIVTKAQLLAGFACLTPGCPHVFKPTPLNVATCPVCRQTFTTDAAG